MILRSLEVANFRKFRDPLRIDGFADGLNIVVEPNETGKSTLLEALRAAFFIRYSAKTELVRSYVPINDDVAPRVAVGFDLNGQSWTLEKQFMKSPFVRLTGEGGRRESDAAEEALQELLGFERGNNRGSDIETRGPLGMLWVEQASALSVENPNRIVRDTVRGVLEAEVGAVTGGKRFDAIRAKIESAYSLLRTPSTGKPRGELLAAETRVSSATTARQQAEAIFRDYEQSLSELETARARLKLVERDLADPETAEQRRKLEADQKVAETVMLRSTAAEAQFGQADAVVKTAVSSVERLDAAERRVSKASAELALRKAAQDKVRSAADQAAEQEKIHRGDLDSLRSKREALDAGLSAARQRARSFSDAAGARRAISNRETLSGLEKRERTLVQDCATAIDKDTLDGLAKLERSEIQARARFDAGAVKVKVELAKGASLVVNGVVSDASSVDVVTATRFQLGEAGSLLVMPPHGSGRSMEADLSSAREELAAALRALGVESYSAAIARNERAGAAERELKALRTQIAATCPGDPIIGLEPGAEALRAFVATLGDTVADIVAPADDIETLEGELVIARLAEAAAAGKHEDCRGALAKAEKLLATAVAEFASASREKDAAIEALRLAATNGDRSVLETALVEARRSREEKLEALETARDGAKAFDLEKIRRSIQNLDRAAGRAKDERLDLTARIGALESTVTREGGSGPAGRLEETREEEQAAVAALERLCREANTLEVLRSALGDAANEATRTFLAPVTRRAARYIHQLLPGSDLSFDQDFGLASLTRAGIEESSGDLSRGTQEQLAILTRLAFADLLLEDGAPISLILDDPLVYSDDARLETMTDILQEASKRMQVILLTCRSKAFRHVDANRIVLR